MTGAEDLPRRPGTSRTVSAWLGGLDGRTWWARDDREQHLAASTMKLPLAVAALRAHAAGTLDLDRTVTVHDDFDSVVPGERFVMDADEDQDPRTWSERGAAVALRDLVHRMLARSGNLAANLVLEQVGTDAVAAVLEEAGCSGRTVVARGIEDAPAREAGCENLVTARDLGLVLAGAADHRLLDAASAHALERDLLAQVHRGGIPAGLPAGVTVANKTGWVGGVSHDVALVRPDDHAAFVLVVLTRHGASEREGEQLVADVAARAWAALGERAGRALHHGDPTPPHAP